MIRAKGPKDDKQFFDQLQTNGITLSGEQIDFIRQVEGAIKVQSPGGNGKSHALILKVAYLISVVGIKPENILVITYTKNAAEELKQRLRQYVSNSNVTACTIHSFCYKLLSTKGGERYRFLNKKIKSDAYRIARLNNVIKKLGLTDNYKAQDLLPQISRAKSILLDDMPGEFGSIFRLYDEMKGKDGTMDFEDLLIDTINLLFHNAPLLESLQMTYSLVFLDEAQDVSPLEYKLVKLISEPQNNLCILGDMNQSVFGFRGGDISIIKGFSRHYPNSKEYFFSTNYRSTNEIVKLCNNFVNRDSTAVRSNGKTPQFVKVKDIYKEAEFIVDNIRQSQRLYKDFAILYRTSKARQHIWDALVLNKIPFYCKDSDDSLYDLYHNKILIANLELVANPHDFKSFKVILPSLNITRAPLLCSTSSLPLLQQLLRTSLLDAEQRLLVARRLNAFNICSGLSTSESINLIRNEGGLDNVFSSNALVNDNIFEDWDYILEESKGFCTIKEFLCYIYEVNMQQSNVDNSNSVTLSTIHAAKGLSYPVVFLIEAVEGIIPHKHSLEPKVNCCINNSVEELIDEEKRLMYVALSRAEDELYVIAPQQRFGKEQVVSRFLEAFFDAQK